MSACFHIAGVACDNCRDYRLVPAQCWVPVVPMPSYPPIHEAVKCPDCGLWWRGMEHRCWPGGTYTVWWTSTTTTPTEPANS